MQLMCPWFLFGLVAIAIPNIIHLLQLRRPQRLLFTNTAIIKDVELVTVRHRNLQRLLLLAVRVLGLAALVLVFCQPIIPAKKGVSRVEGNNVLVDNSFSMQVQMPSQGSLFGEAVAEAGEIGRNSSTSERFRLINDGGGELNQAAFRAKLADLKLTSHNPFAKIREQVIAKRGRFYLISDFQRNAFDSRLLKELNNEDVVLMPVVGKAAGNVYVDSVWLDDAFVRVRTNVGLHIRLRNGGTVAVSECPVKVFLGEQQVAAFRVSIEPQKAVTSLVQVQVNDARLALGRVVTEDVPVTFDNNYYFTLQPAAAIQIVEIGNEPNGRSLYGNEPLFAYSSMKPNRVNYGALLQANLVIIRELPLVDAGLQDALRNVVKRGGSLVVVPSALTASHESYQRLFERLGLGTAQWESATTTPELREVAMPNADEPFFRNVFGAQQRAVTMPRVASVLRWARTGTDILRLRDGESYLANFASGAGQVYVFSAPFSEQYSDFVSHALFVPVMYRMAMLSYQNEQLPAYRLTQGTVGVKVPFAEVAREGGTNETAYRLVRDSLTLIPAQRVVGNDLRLELPAGMNEPGFYQVQRGGKVLTTLAFNQDKRESELAAYSSDELRQLIGPNRPNIKVVEPGANGAGLRTFQAEQEGQPLWRYFLAFVLACLLAEALLVRFGGWRARATSSSGA